MKWINHQIVSGVVVYAFTDNLLYTVYGMLGSLLPDKLEGDPRRAADYWRWRSSHRGWSHWPVPYLSLILLFLLVEDKKLAGEGFLPFSMMAVFLLIGAVLHILEDAVCGKVPLIYLTKKSGIKLFKVGSFKEYFFSAFVAVVVWLLKLVHLAKLF